MNEKIKKLEEALTIAENEKRILTLRLAAAEHQIQAYNLLRQAGEIQLALDAYSKKKDGES